jgi:alpha-glucosidase (family GH31 glycosyl hydrolase)
VWFDYWTGKQYRGRQYINVVSPLDVLPLFVKAGSAIPMQPAMRYTGENAINTITLDVFPAGNSTGSLYEDDGQSLRYRQKEYCLTSFSTFFSGKGAEIKINKPSGQFIPAKHNYLIRLHSAAKPSLVTENGRSVNETTNKNTGWSYNANEKLLYIATAGDNTEAIDIKMIF